MATPTVVLKKGREKSVLRRHPWVFSGAVERVEGNPGTGDLVRVAASDGSFLGWGHHSPFSRIRVRLCEWQEGAVVDAAWVRRRIAGSVGRRASLAGETEAVRLVHAEADLLPGLVVDRYGPHVVVQANSAGADSIRGWVVDALRDILEPASILDRSDNEARALEGLPPAGGTLLGTAPSGPVPIKEGSLSFLADLQRGQKTGFFIDQRENRRRAAAHAAGRVVLDAFSYTGSFAASCLAAGAASATLVDSSAPALALARGNLELNGVLDRAELVEEDVFALLRSFRDAGRSFDMVVLDPPKLAPTRASVERAAAAYKDINLLAIKLLRPDGILVTFSCSGAFDAARLFMTVAWAAADSRRDVQVVERLSQGPDHPVLLSFPESEYLKGLICRVL